jgi:hypothetical protein
MLRAMPAALRLVPALVVTIVLAANVGFSPSASPSTCSRAAAKRAVAASRLPQRVKIDASGRYGGGIDMLICRDLTGDDQTELIASIFSGGTAGDHSWLVFAPTQRGWKLAFRRLNLYKVGIRAGSNGIVETLPVYNPDDPNCCPSGGFDHRLYRWRHGRFVVARSWHTNGP